MTMMKNSTHLIFQILLLSQETTIVYKNCKILTSPFLLASPPVLVFKRIIIIIIIVAPPILILGLFLVAKINNLHNNARKRRWVPLHCCSFFPLATPLLIHTSSTTHCFHISLVRL
ncbi:hypothetical protein NC652_041229 [Populus alba x Populus x berolinensis]|nr:hypothetical protein NC652_041229 [Populus alba x Populus x berolinensis]